MDEDLLLRMRRIWNQQSVPVIARGGKTHRLRLRLPLSSGNNGWIQNGRRHSPEWTAARRHWEAPQSRFNDLVARCLAKFGRVYIIQPYRVQEKCAPACWNTAGHECQCSGMGANDGSGHPGGLWFIVSDAFAARWSNEDYACRLLTLRSAR